MRRPLGEVVPGEPEHGPAGQDQSVLAAPVIANPAHIAVPRPTDDLDSDPVPGKCKIQLEASFDVVQLPPADAGPAQKGDQLAFSGRSGSISGGDQQLASGDRAPPTKVSAVRLIQARNSTRPCSARSRNSDPRSPSATAASSTVNGTLVTQVPRVQTRSASASSRRRARIPGGRGHCGSPAQSAPQWTVSRAATDATTPQRSR
jgi:hypothetical protein